MLERLGKRPAATLVLVTAVVFLPSVLLGFVFDDLLLISQNSDLQQPSALGKAFFQHFWATRELDQSNVLRYYRPLVSVTYTLNWLMAAGAPWVFHLTNVALHAGAVFAAFRVAERWLADRRLVIVAAVLFALHPSRWENVMWVSGRTDVMLALFCFLAVLCVRRGFAGRRSALWFALAALSSAAACLSKEGGAFLPLLFLVEYFASAGALPAKQRAKQRLAVAGFSVLPVAYLVWRLAVFPVRESSGSLTPKYFLLTVWAYAERIFIPWPQTFFYRPLVIIDGVVQVPLWILIGGGALVLLYTALVVHAFRKDRGAATLLLTAVAFLGPLLNFRLTGVPSTASDRFLYLPLFFLVCGLLRLWSDAALRAWSQQPARLLAVGVGIAYVGLLWTRLGPMQREADLWEHEYALRPDSPIALRQTARRLAAQGETQEAYRRYVASLSPQSRRYRLIAFPSDQASTIVEMRGIEAGFLPDGATKRLTALYDELAELEAGYPPNGGRLGIDPQTYAALIGRQGPRLRGELALLASRLGRQLQTQAYLRKIPAEDEARVANAMNLALAAARAHDWAEADRWLGVEARLQEVHRSASTPEALGELKARIARSKQAHARARELPQEQRQVLMAQVAADLGAYGVAARGLEKAYKADPKSQGIAQLYTQVLVASRRDQAAKDVVAAALGKDKAAEIVAGIRAQLPEALRDIPAVDE
ncbi:MAG: hypothetical protein H6718_13680 [Polyangiaceae bacterium]|nr:hypothetical protein [Polyangiaceae bacterium]MCB9605952.1 hypothetical protein [Polyangiaceae bacterium]